MEYLWWLLVFITMTVYPVVLVRSALAGKRWARETLEAMRYLGGDAMTTSAWRSLPPERAPPSETPAQDDEGGEQDRGRLVA